MDAPFGGRLKGALKRKTAIIRPKRGKPSANDESIAENVGPTSELGRLLTLAPRPLIHPTAKMIVVFSPKSACTTVVSWFFDQLGHGRAARDFHSWPHRYRSQVYYHSRLYERALEKNLANFALVRVVRDPFDRAASSYRHALKHGNANADFAKVMGRPDAASEGFSFAEFLDLLERIDLTTCDRHYAQQKHPVEDAKTVDHLINISTQDLHAGLNAVDRAVGLPTFDFNATAKFEKIRRKRFQVHGQAEATDVYATRFNQKQAKEGPWPPYEALLTPLACERLARIYAVDIAAYLSPSDTTRAPHAVAAT
jgi:hypothetical protein